MSRLLLLVTLWARVAADTAPSPAYTQSEGQRWLSCPCTVQATEAAGENAAAVAGVVAGLVSNTPCLQSPAGDTVEEAWYQYVLQAFPGDACAEGCRAHLYTGSYVPLFVPWARVRACGAFPALIPALTVVMKPELLYATVHSLPHGLYGDPAAVPLASFDVTELEPSGDRGVYVPALPALSTSAGTQGAGRAVTLGYCSPSTALMTAVLHPTPGNQSLHTDEWPTLDEDWSGCAFSAVKAARTFTGPSFGVCTSPSPEGVVDTACSSEFMLCPQSVGRACDSLLTILTHGAIPVYVWEDGPVLPYPHHLPWLDMIVSIRRDQVHTLEAVLLSISPRKRTIMRSLISSYSSVYFTRQGVLGQTATWFAHGGHSALRPVGGFPFDVHYHKPITLSVVTRSNISVAGVHQGECPCM